MAGVSNKVLARRVAKGLLEQPHGDVFIAFPRQFTRAMAAVLQFRGDALLTRGAAGFVWGLVDGLPEVIDVLVVGRSARSEDLRVHRVPTLHRDEIRSRHGIPITSPARTLVDLAATLTPLELENALAEARLRKLVRDGQLRAALERARGRKGSATLRALLERAVAPARTRSHAERRLLDLIRRAELPAPVTNVPVEGHVVDMFWPEQRLVVEFDGFAYHGDRSAFERDRLRDQRLVAAGYRVIRITARQLEESPYAVMVRLAQALCQE